MHPRPVRRQVVHRKAAQQARKVPLHRRRSPDLAIRAWFPAREIRASRRSSRMRQPARLPRSRRNPKASRLSRREKPADKAGKPEEKAAEQPAGETKTKDSADKPTQPKPGTAKSTESKTGDTAKGAGGATAKVEPQKIQKVKTYFTAHKPNVKRVDRNAVSVSVGIALPASIALYPLPPDVVVVIGSCPLEYFVWGEDIVLVELVLA